MIPVPQRIVGHLKAEQRGDCYKCCIASILELPYDDVPHFAQGEPDSRYNHFTNVGIWLRARKFPLELVSTAYLNKDGPFVPDDVHSQYVYEATPRNWHPGYWIATVKSRVYPQSQHAIVMKGSAVAFDPSPSAADPAPYEFCGEDVLVPDLPALARAALNGAGTHMEQVSSA